MLWLAVFLSGCDGEKDTFSLQQKPHVSDTATEDLCPDGMLQVDGRHIVAGEWDEDEIDFYAPNIIPQATWEVADFCMDTYPWPGIEGDGWMPDGLNWDPVVELEALLDQVGLRMCTVGELLYGAAGPDNWRYPYESSDFEEDKCDPEDHTPLVMGTYPDCVSSTGFRDFGIRSAWARLDEQALEVLVGGDIEALPEGDGSYGIYGGTSRQDTYHAPSNFGMHYYGPGNQPYVTDDIRVCSDISEDVPDEQAERKILALREAFLSQGSYAAMLDE